MRSDIRRVFLSSTLPLKAACARGSAMARNLDLSNMRCVVATPEPSFATAASRGSSSLVYFPSHYTYLRTCVTAWHGKRSQRRGSAACEGDASRTPHDVSGRRDSRTRKHRTVCQGKPPVKHPLPVPVPVTVPVPVLVLVPEPLPVVASHNRRASSRHQSVLCILMYF